MEFITSGNRIATENFSIGKIYTVTFTNGNYFINTCVGIGSDFVMFQQEAPKMLFCLDMESAETVSTIDESGGGSGTDNYNELNNKPSINGVILIGNKTAADLSILPVPIVGENDNNKVLTASYSGGVGSYSWQPASGSGTTDYTQLTNKPQINSVELNGNKSLADLGIASAEALSGKQDVISDLNTIRSGAAAGATAVQPATLAGYQTLIDSSHKLSSDLVDDTGHTNKFATAAQLAQIGTNTAAIAGKQDALSSSQLAAVNSGITSALVTQIGTNTSAIAGKQDALSSSQLAAVNSGITSTDVTQITTNKNNISLVDLYNAANFNVVIGTAYNPSKPDVNYVQYSFYRDVSANVEMTAYGYVYVKDTVSSLTVDTVGATVKTYTGGEHKGYARVSVPDEGNGTTCVGFVVLNGKYVYSNLCSTTYANVVAKHRLTGNIDNISENNFDLYTSSSTNLPVNSDCFIRTTVSLSDSSRTRLQEAFVVSTGVSYVRTMSNGVWNNWLQLTNQ